MKAQKNRFTLFSKIKQLSIPALSLAVCCLTATSTLADTYSNQKCAQLSWEYDDLIQMKQN